MSTLEKKETSFQEIKIKVFYSDDSWKYITVKFQNLFELTNIVETISSLDSVLGVELCIADEEESEQKTEEETDAVSCSDVADATLQDKLDIF